MSSYVLVVYVKPRSGMG